MLDHQMNEQLRALDDPKRLTPPERIALGSEILKLIAETYDGGFEMPDHLARFIAYGITTGAPDDNPSDVLINYYLTGAGSHEDLRAEYLRHYFSDDATSAERLFIDVLGTHLFRKEQHITAPAPTGGGDFALAILDTTTWLGDVATLMQLPRELGRRDHLPVMHEIAHHVAQKGDPFRAFLRLPGIDATEDSLLTEFELAYLGDTDQPEALQALADRQAAGLGVDAVEIGGIAYVFAR
jgi:hypothetical protein